MRPFFTIELPRTLGYTFCRITPFKKKINVVARINRFGTNMGIFPGKLFLTFKRYNEAFGFFSNRIVQSGRR
jgi:hypothetical protein